MDAIECERVGLLVSPGFQLPQGSDGSELVPDRSIVGAPLIPMRPTA